SSPSPTPTPKSSRPCARSSTARRRRPDHGPAGCQMTRRKLVAAALFFTLAGVVAMMPPFVLLFQFEESIFGVPVEAAYIFFVWALLVFGARAFSRLLPDDPPAPE